MMHRPALFLLALPMLLSTASAPVLSRAETADQILAKARTESERAERRLATLEAQAERAGDTAARLKAEQIAAAAAIEAAEARISSSNAELQLARTRVALLQRRLDTRRAPLAALLAGIAQMGRRPPLLSLVNGASVDEIVRVRALLDATMPVIQRRSASLSAELRERQQLAFAADTARARLGRDRADLIRQQARFAELEIKASQRADQLATQAFGAGDRVLAAGETLSAADSEAARQRAAATVAASLAGLEFSAARPMAGDAPLPAPDLAYDLPAAAPIADGLGSVSRSGIVSRGIRLSTVRGARIAAPAAGKISFAAPYRGQDGLVIMDHGNGWTTLLLGVASDKPRGSRLDRGAPLGRALGPVGVELRHRGVPVSPAFIAASSLPLSNSGNSR